MRSCGACGEVAPGDARAGRGATSPAGVPHRRAGRPAGTDCGFDTFIRFSQVDPDVTWLQLRALADGAQLATSELW